MNQTVPRRLTQAILIALAVAAVVPQGQADARRFIGDTSMNCSSIFLDGWLTRAPGQAYLTDSRGLPRGFKQWASYETTIASACGPIGGFLKCINHLKVCTPEETQFAIDSGHQYDPMRQWRVTSPQALQVQTISEAQLMETFG